MAGAVSLDAEYIAAVDGFDTGLLGDSVLTPEAWNTEIAYAITEDLELAVKYEGSKEFPDMPETQFGVGGTYAIIENVSFALEYLHGTFKEDDVEDRDIVTCQLAVEF